MFTVCENTNLKGKNDKFGDMHVVYSMPAMVKGNQMVNSMTQVDAPLGPMTSLEINTYGLHVTSICINGK